MVIKPLIITFLVCHGSIPHSECTKETAISAREFAAPPGYITCGVPYLVTSMERPISLKEDEYVRIRCGIPRD